MTRVTEENYLNYLTHHGRSIDAAWNVVKNWGARPEYYSNEAIGLWVDASAKFLEQATWKVK